MYLDKGIRRSLNHFFLINYLEFNFNEFKLIFELKIDIYYFIFVLLDGYI